MSNIKDVSLAIEKIISENDNISKDSVSFSWENGKIVLTGTVSSLEESEELENEIASLEGVELIINNLEIKRF